MVTNAATSPTLPSSADRAGDPAASDAAPVDELGRRLVTAAAEVFAERGYEGAGVQEIARRAGLTTGAIYSRFSGKAELLAAAVSDGASAELNELFSTGDAGVDVTEAIRMLGRRLIDGPPDGKNALLLEAFVAARRDPEVAELMARHVAGVRADFARLVDIAQRRGDLAEDVDTDALVHFCQAVGFGFLLFEAVGAARPDTGAWDQLIDRLVAAVETDDQTDITHRSNAPQGEK